MEYYNNALCITGSELIIKRDEDGNVIRSGVIEKYYYDNLKRRGDIKIHGRGGNGREIYIEFDSIARSDVKALIREKLGDTKAKAEIKPFRDSIQQDPKAVDFFNTYLVDDKHLSEKLKQKYCNDAALLNAIHNIYVNYHARRVAVGSSIKNFWSKALKAIIEYRAEYEREYEQVYPCSLPDSEKRLRLRYEEYRKEGYKGLISDKVGNSNSEKICEEAKDWILSKWAQRIEIVPGESQMLQLYNKEAETRGWKQLKNVGTIANFLFRDDIKSKWWAHRYGELKAKEKFNYQHSTILPSVRDSLWYSDGTKLNYFYLNEDGKIETCQVYEVMDVFSECFLGYHISKTEDYEAQYFAYKMALKTSGFKPYEIRFDNQGGHSKLKNGDFLKNLAHLAINTAPYNGKSKTIESAFGRFQHEFLTKEWYFTGQNITTKKLESKANMEMILANKANLPTLQQVKEKYLMRRNEWNNAPHHKTGLPRIEMYNQSHNPKSVKVEMWDMVDLFWITRAKEVTCTAQGITFEEKGEKYQYVVYKSDRMPDVEWIRRNVDKKFVVKFDPDDFSLIYLYEKMHDGLRFCTEAETKILTHRGIQEQEDWEAEYYKNIELENKRLRIEDRDKMDSILEIHNMLPEQHGLVSPNLKGIENKRKSNIKAKKVDIATVQKAVSNATLLDDEEFDEKSIYGLY